MRPVEIYFAFNRPDWRRLFSEDPHTAFGHVSAFGITVDDTWFFLDPTRKGIDLRITHRHDDVQQEIARIAAGADIILRTESTGPLRLPPFTPCTCAAVCGYLVGIRAFTPMGLARRLRAIGAHEVKNEKPQGRQGREGAARA